MDKTVFITGATSGIGKATAILLANKKYRLILCGRRQERLRQLQNDLEKITEVTTLQFDVRFKKEVLLPLKIFLKTLSILTY